MIKRVYDENFAVYGAEEVGRQLLREGIVVARCTPTAGLPNGSNRPNFGHCDRSVTRPHLPIIRSLFGHWWRVRSQKP